MTLLRSPPRRRFRDDAGAQRGMRPVVASRIREPVE